jgi:hypothetical protein
MHSISLLPVWNRRRWISKGSQPAALLGGAAVAACLAATGCGSSGSASTEQTDAQSGFVGLSERAARRQAMSLLRAKYPQTDAELAYVSQGFDPVGDRNAWDIAFYDHRGGVYTGCHVYVWDGGGRVGSCEKAGRPQPGS